MNNNVMNKGAVTERESLTDLLTHLAANSAAVVHDEIELRIQRVKEKIRAVRSAVVTMAIGGVIGFAAFLALCAALIIGLSYYMNPFAAALVAGIGLALIGIVIAFMGYRILKKSVLKDDRI